MYDKDQGKDRYGIDESDGIVALIRETADGFGHLLADHVKLARLELVADVKKHGRRVAIIAVLVPFIFLGYGLACLGLAVVLSRFMGMAESLFLVGGFHLIGGAIAIAVAARRLRGGSALHDTTRELSRSVTTLAATAASNGSPSIRRD